jgi:hypothetical protein
MGFYPVGEDIVYMVRWSSLALPQSAALRSFFHGFAMAAALMVYVPHRELGSD